MKTPFRFEVDLDIIELSAYRLLNLLKEAGWHDVYMTRTQNNVLIITGVICIL